MRFCSNMTAPASRKKEGAFKLLPVIGGFVLFSLVALFDQRIALALAIGTIGFAGISMVVALARKH